MVAKVVVSQYVLNLEKNTLGIILMLKVQGSGELREIRSILDAKLLTCPYWVDYSGWHFRIFK